MREVNKLALVWGKWEPYHVARFNALVKAHGPDNCIGVSLAGESETYNWTKSNVASSEGRILILNPEITEEKLGFLKIFRQFVDLIHREQIAVVFVCSYWPARQLAVLIAGRVMGAKCVMMNESHAGTERAKGVKRLIKRLILRLFHAGLVGGKVQEEHFTFLGMPRAKLFDGYDVVDNEFYARGANDIRHRAEEARIELGLPEKYILNIGRMVERKNLRILIEAYARLLRVPHGLVLVGCGPEEAELRRLSVECGLEVRDLVPGISLKVFKGTVFFAGARQTEANVAFFALADVFVMPSHTEEWGLVVNEAMACGLPVIVSRHVGSAGDLVKEGINGFLFDPSEAGELSQIINNVLSSERKRLSLGSQSKRIIEKWGCDRFARNTLKALEAAQS